MTHITTKPRSKSVISKLSKLIFCCMPEIAYGPPTTFRRNSDGCKEVRRNSVGIVQSQTAIQRSYVFVGNGHMVRRNSVGKYRWNSDDFAVTRNVVGIPSEYTDELPTTTTVTFFIGMSSKSRRKIPTNRMSSEFRRKWPTEFRRLHFFGFGRKFVSIPSQMSDDLGVRRKLRRNSECFLVVLSSTCFYKRLDNIITPKYKRSHPIFLECIQFLFLGEVEPICKTGDLKNQYINFSVLMWVVGNLISDLHIEWSCHRNDHRHTHCEFGKIPLIGCGGVRSGEDAYKKTRAGATIFQLYIGFAYGGPALIPQKTYLIHKKISGKTVNRVKLSCVSSSCHSHVLSMIHRYGSLTVNE
ncbi:hypothetical protein YC2023_050486 [Brassica napus]